MVKKLITILLLFSISTAYSQCGFADDYSFTNLKSLEKGNLKGNIQEISSEYFETLEKFGKHLNGKLKCKRQVSLNKDNTINEITEYNDEGKISGFYKYEYNDGTIKSISEYKKNGDFFAKTVFIKNKNKIREQRYITNGDPNGHWLLRTLDLNGRMTKEERKNHDDVNEIRETFYEYDDSGRVIRIKTDDFFSKVEYNKSTLNFPTKVEVYNSERGKLFKEIRYEYNSEGDLIKEYKDGILVYSYEYEYDKNNNWIKRTEFKTEAEIPLEIIDRQILYYN